MPASSTAAPALFADTLTGSGARLFIFGSTYASTDFAYMPGVDATSGTSVTSATSATTALNIGFFRGVGEFSKGLGGVGLRVGDLVAHVSQANWQSSDTWPSSGADSYASGLVTLHSVVGSTPGGSTNSPSVGYDVTLGQ